MPRMKITSVDGRQIEVVGSDSLKAELDRYKKAMEALLPDLEGEDDAAGDRALLRHNDLAAAFNRIMDQLEGWNKVVAEENRDKRKALAAKIRKDCHGG